MYARMRFTGGRESNVSLRDLAPCPRPGEVDTDDLPTDSVAETQSPYTNHNGNTRGGSRHGSINPATVPKPSETSEVRSQPERVTEVVETESGAINARGDRNPVQDLNMCESSSVRTPNLVIESRTPSIQHESPAQAQRQSSRRNRGVPPVRYRDVLSFIYEG